MNSPEINPDEKALICEGFFFYQLPIGEFSPSINKDKKTMNMTIKIINQNDFYKTSDLACSTALVFFDCLIEKIEKVTPRKAVFVFKRNQKLDKVLTKYWQRKLKVEPAAYFEQLSFIKSRLYAQE